MSQKTLDKLQAEDLFAQRIALFLNPLEGWRRLIETGAKPWLAVAAIESIETGEEAETVVEFNREEQPAAPVAVVEPVVAAKAVKEIDGGQAAA